MTIYKYCTLVSLWRASSVLNRRAVVQFKWQLLSKFFAVMVGLMMWLSKDLPMGSSLT